MLTVVRRILGFELTIAEWIGTAILLAIPYLAVGVLWSATHTEHPGGRSGIDGAASFLGSIASWPALLLSEVCLIR